MLEWLTTVPEGIGDKVPRSYIHTNGRSYPNLETRMFENLNANVPAG